MASGFVLEHLGGVFPGDSDHHESWAVFRQVEAKDTSALPP
jgi:hypothetical protein